MLKVVLLRKGRLGLPKWAWETLELAWSLEGPWETSLCLLVWQCSELSCAGWPVDTRRAHCLRVAQVGLAWAPSSVFPLRRGKCCADAGLLEQVEPP